MAIQKPEWVFSLEYGDSEKCHRWCYSSDLGSTGWCPENAPVIESTENLRISEKTVRSEENVNKRTFSTRATRRRSRAVKCGFLENCYPTGNRRSAMKWSDVVCLLISSTVKQPLMRTSSKDTKNMSIRACTQASNVAAARNVAAAIPDFLLCQTLLFFATQGSIQGPVLGSSSRIMLVQKRHPLTDQN